MQSELPQLLDGAEPRFYCGGDLGCLIIHGFMASPGEVGWLGQRLAEQGYTVYITRLPGMGANPADMRRMRWQDWYLGALDGYHILKQQCARVFVIGHSMGGMLAMLLAARENPDGLVVAATPVHVEDFRIRYARLLQYIMPYTHHESGESLQRAILEEQKRRGERETGRAHYTAWHTRALYEIYVLIKLLPDYMPRVTAPLLLLYAKEDTTATAADQDWISRQVSSQIVEQHVLHAGGHILFQDVDREEAFRVVAGFIARYH